MRISAQVKSCGGGLRRVRPTSQVRAATAEFRLSKEVELLLRETYADPVREHGITGVHACMSPRPNVERDLRRGTHGVGR